MAEIQLSGLRHSYLPNPRDPQDYALKEINVAWKDGGAYALLGPSGCGKTTLLNIISGLIAPSEGSVLFDGQDVTSRPPDMRNIAQVFQFPVIYDTMTVAENLSFPLRNRGEDPKLISQRVGEIAELLGVTEILGRRASGLNPDNKQKISMGRALVRNDVNVVMFDEPLTVIDPQLKWRLRSKLKELHHRVQATMIYVTHDQTEALTFAEEVVVMRDGEIVQTGTPVELFERPQHTFVGHFIGSPGMNILPCEGRGDRAAFQGHEIELEGPIAGEGGELKLGIRPEHILICEDGIPATVAKVSDAGRHYVIDAVVGDSALKAVSERAPPHQGNTVHLRFPPERSRVYRDGWIATEIRG